MFCDQGQLSQFVTIELFFLVWGDVDNVIGTKSGRNWPMTILFKLFCFFGVCPFLLF